MRRRTDWNVRPGSVRGRGGGFRSRVRAVKAESAAVISGFGASEVGRRTLRDPLMLTLDAAQAAVTDAGIELCEIDGLATYPGAIGSTPGITGAGIDDMRTLLGLKTR